MENYFEKIENLNPASPRRSVYPLDHYRVQTQGIGCLCPSLVLETMPGDTFTIGNTIFARTQPLLAPLMHKIDIHTQFFFVPYRICCDNFEKLINDPRDTKAILPNISLQSVLASWNYYGEFFGLGSLADYLGIPSKRLVDMARNTQNLADDRVINVLDFIAYQLIAHYWYSDRQLSEWKDYEDNIIPRLRAATTLTGNPSDLDLEIFGLKYAPFELDYFTKATREPQLGDPVQFPFSGQAPVSSSVADFDAEGAVVNTLLRDVRTAVDIEHWLERQNAAGGDYRETILQHFGVWNNDGRLQRPEYIGQNTQPFMTNDVAATADSDTTNVGDLSGKSQSFDSSRNFQYSPTEHGVLIGISYILPETLYFQGLSRHFTRMTTFDFPFPEFQNLGPQAIEESELYLCSNADDKANNDIFGYNSRYGEYKQHNSSCHGYMSDIYKYWHLGREFSHAPALNPLFTECYPFFNNLNRAFSVTTDNTRVNAHNYFLDVYNRVTAVRPLDYSDQPHSLTI